MDVPQSGQATQRLLARVEEAAKMLSLSRSQVYEMLRHAQISTTMNIYGHVIEDVQREAVEGLDALFDDPGVLEIPPRKPRSKLRNFASEYTSRSFGPRMRRRLARGLWPTHASKSRRAAAGSKWRASLVLLIIHCAAGWNLSNQ